MNPDAVTLRANPARVYVALDILASAIKNPHQPPSTGSLLSRERAAVKRKALYAFCDRWGLLDGKQPKRMKFRDAIDRLVEAGVVEKLSGDYLAISRSAPPPHLPEFPLDGDTDSSLEDAMFVLYRAGLIEFIAPCEQYPDGAWRRTAEGVAYEQARKAAPAAMTPAQRGDAIMQMITEAGGPDNRPVDLFKTLGSTFSPSDWQPIWKTLLAQERLYSYAEQLPSDGLWVVRANGPQDPTWRYYRAANGRIVVMPQGSAPPPESTLQPINAPRSVEPAAASV